MLKALYIMPTERCNSRCTYCYIPDKATSVDAEEATFFQALDEFLQPRSIAPRQLRFIGGEPYLKASLVLRLIDRFMEKEPGGTVVANTNATLISEETAASLAKHGSNVTHIVSMDGTAAVHDKKRKMLDGTSAHARAVEGIERLRAQGLPVYLNAVVDRKTVERLGELMVLAKERFDFGVLSVSLLQRSYDPMTLEEQFDTLERAYEIADEHCMEITGHHRLYAGARIEGLRCRAGDQTLLVTGQGKLTACQRFLKEEDGALPISVAEGQKERRRLNVTASNCYTDQIDALAGRLQDLYEAKYPKYLEVRPADRVVFGTIA